MKHVLFVFLVVFSLGGCDWQKNRAIKADLNEIYGARACFEFSSPYPFILDVNAPDYKLIEALKNQEFLMSTQIRNPEGILGYSITEGSIWSQKANDFLNDTKQFCYGTQSIDTLKVIADQGEKKRVSFTLITTVDKQWRDHSVLKKWFKPRAQLLRKTLIKKNNQWVLEH